VQKTELHSTPFAPPTAAAHSRWDTFVTECVDWMTARAYAGVLTRSTLAEGRLLAVFDVFGSWLDGRDAEAAAVVDAVLSVSDRHPAGRIVALQAPAVRAIVMDLSRQAGLVDVEDLADSWLILVAGTVHRAAHGDAAAPARAGAMAEDLIARHRPALAPDPLANDGESEFAWIEDEAVVRSVPPVNGADVDTPSNFDWFDGYGWDGELVSESRMA
jgi:hypothetical protein